MNGYKPWALLGAAALALSTSASAANITLFEYGFNVDGAVSTSPAGANLAGFDTSTGLGQISFTLTGAGSHYVSLFVDHEIDENINTFFNEEGSVAGAAAAGQSWEIDEPGFHPTDPGDIYANFVAGALDGLIGKAYADDVSMAMGWSFALASGETASIAFTLSTTAPGSGFYLTQIDPDSPAALYFWSSLSITGGGQNIPEPTSLALVALGLAGAWQARRRPAAKLAP